VRARGKSDSKTDRQTLRRIVQNHFSRRFEGCTSQIRSYLEVYFLRDANTSIDMEVKLPEAIVPKVGHGPNMGQNGFDRDCLSAVFPFVLCFIAHSYEANGGGAWKYLPASGPVFETGFVRICGFQSGGVSRQPDRFGLCACCLSRNRSQQGLAYEVLNRLYTASAISNTSAVTPSCYCVSSTI